MRIKRRQRRKECLLSLLTALYTVRTLTLGWPIGVPFEEPGSLRLSLVVLR